MNTLVLESSDATRWNSYISQITEADIYFRAEYCRIYEENGEGAAKLFIYSEGDHFVCYPFLLRCIDDLPAIRDAGIGKSYYDIATPYGYGGPLVSDPSPESRDGLMKRFSAAFHRYCLDQNVVTEFVRFHPILKNHEWYPEVKPSYVKNTICLHLTDDETTITGRYKSDNRNRIRKARKEGLNIVHGETDRLEHLLKLYYSTMDRNHAIPYYYFNESFFLNTVNLLDGNIELFEIMHQDKIIASCLFMHFNHYVHYHLMGSDLEYLKFAPINLLIHEAMLWAKGKGYKYLHLGGGYSGNDSLYRFKKTFNEEKSLDYYVGNRIHMPDVYGKLEEHIRELAEEDYFPIYRHPSLRQKLLMRA
ncbi:MAG: hypothetical protein K0R28_55 [Paenibacillus sp.]|jgi:hypothetical protein|nr:hypothetical protein [Paenibacillus sp.]